MSVSISIHPLSDQLEMHGKPDTSSAYSLSGHVSVSVNSPFSLFERRRMARILMRSISLTFEGQCEVYTPHSGYSGIRLCSITRELATLGPMELNNEGQEESDSASTWNFVFNLPIPGWLPATTTIGIEDLGVRYTLFATANFSNLEEQASSSWSFLSLCTPFRSRGKTVSARRAIILKRVISASSIDAVEHPSVNYIISCQPSKVVNSEDDDKNGLPTEILSKIQLMASVPSHADINSDSLPFTLRLRTKDMDEADCKRIQVVSMKLDIIQREKFRDQPTSAYTAYFPLPPTEMQPPNEPLREPHPMSFVYDMGLYMPVPFSDASGRSFSLLPKGESGEFKLENDNYVFAKDNDVSQSPPTWYTIQASIPVTQHCATYAGTCAEWAGAPIIRPETSSPLYEVYHDVSISLSFSYDKPDGDEKAYETLNFSVPVTFAEVAKSSTSSLNISNTVVEMNQPLPTLPLTPPTQCLPAYSELYHSNGDRKIDYSTPLPLYTPKSLHGIPSASTEHSLSTGPPSPSNPPPLYHYDQQEKLAVETPLIISLCT